MTNEDKVLAIVLAALSAIMLISAVVGTFIGTSNKN